jgi:hypothetical protein
MGPSGSPTFVRNREVRNERIITAIALTSIMASPVVAKPAAKYCNTPPDADASATFTRAPVGDFEGPDYLGRDPGPSIRLELHPRSGDGSLIRLRSTRRAFDRLVFASCRSPSPLVGSKSPGTPPGLFDASEDYRESVSLRCRAIRRSKRVIEIALGQTARSVGSRAKPYSPTMFSPHMSRARRMRARLTRLFIVPTSQLAMAAASS